MSIFVVVLVPGAFGLWLLGMCRAAGDGPHTIEEACQPRKGREG